MFPCTYQKDSETSCPHLQFQFNSGMLENVQIPSSNKPYINSYSFILIEPTFGAHITTSELFPFHILLKTLEETSSIMSSLVSM